MFGNRGNDLLEGKAGPDVLHGNQGNDFAFLGAGDDRRFRTVSEPTTFAESVRDARSLERTGADARNRVRKLRAQRCTSLCWTAARMLLSRATRSTAGISMAATSERLIASMS